MADNARCVLIIPGDGMHIAGGACAVSFTQFKFAIVMMLFGCCVFSGPGFHGRGVGYSHMHRANGSIRSCTTGRAGITASNSRQRTDW